VGSQDKMVAVSRLKACIAANATPGSPRRGGRLPGSCPGGLAATKQVSFSDPLVSLPSPSLAPPCNGPRTISYLARRFLHARDQQCLHSLHRHGTCPVSGHRPRGPTSDPFSSQPRPELGGSPVESCLCSWRQSNQSSVL
jgi:hypothetical protein